MPALIRSVRIAFLLFLFSTWLVLPTTAGAAAKGKLPGPARKDLCASVFGGSIPYERSQYHWFCSGKVPVPPKKSITFSLQCGPGKFDKRKKYGYWVSSSALTLTQVAWDPSYGELNLTFHNSASKQQSFEYWESCLGSA